MAPASETCGTIYTSFRPALELTRGIDDCVSWQSAFWALVPFLLSVMTQPCGQVCHFPLRLRTYLRCSPFVCAADNIGIIIHMALLMHAGCRPREAARAVLMARRIENGVCEHTGQGLQSLENTGLVRILLFCLGTLPQVVKLMALSGIPWTKVWAGVYLGSFVTVEILLLMAEDQERNAEDTSISNRVPPFEHLSTVKLVLGIFSIVTHLTFGAWAYHQILSEHIISKVSEDSSAWSLPFVRVPSVLFVSSGLLGLSLCVLEGYTEDIPLQIPDRTGRITCVCLYFVVFAFLLLPGTESFVAVGLNFDYYLNYILVFYVFLFVLFFLSIASRNIQVCVLLLEHQLLVSGSKTRGTDIIVSFSTCVLFLGTVVLSIAWYSMCYDAIGTHKPEWVNILG